MHRWPGSSELIRVYLTFPLGERALALASGSKDVYAIPDGMILSLGVLPLHRTGMLLGIPFHMALMRFTSGKSLGVRLGFATVLALLLWFVNFYLVLTWLQPCCSVVAGLRTRQCAPMGGGCDACDLWLDAGSAAAVRQVRALRAATRPWKLLPHTEAGSV